MATGNRAALLNSYLNELLLTGQVTTSNSFLWLTCHKGKETLHSRGVTRKSIPLSGKIKPALKAALKKYYI